jgi:hypothetical protein
MDDSDVGVVHDQRGCECAPEVVEGAAADGGPDMLGIRDDRERLDIERCATFGIEWEQIRRIAMNKKFVAITLAVVIVGALSAFIRPTRTM